MGWGGILRVGLVQACLGALAAAQAVRAFETRRVPHAGPEPFGVSWAAGGS
ncbi:MAG: hypothetical protein JOY70_04470 [Acidisphaera sp.]|nr:hypothetical protein [Acidisphaera sp.]